MAFGGGFNFSLPGSTAAASTAPTLGSTFNQPTAVTAGFNFGTKPATGGLTLGGSSVTTTASSLFSLGNVATTTASTGVSFNLASNSTTPKSTGLSLFTPTAAPTSTSGQLTLGSNTSAFSVATTQTKNTLPIFPTGASLSTATTTSSTFGTVGTSAPPNLSMRQLEEKLNKWLVELKEQEERFIRQAAHVNSWDQVLQNGHDQVQALKDTVHTVKSDQSRLEAELDFIRGQQDELERLLDPLESAISSTPASQLNQGDRQRDNMYHLAQNLDGQLRTMTDDLGKVIEHLNTNTSSAQPNDPVSLVTRILSAHMDTLKWIDHNTAVMSQKADEIASIANEVSTR